MNRNLLHMSPHMQEDVLSPGNYEKSVGMIDFLKEIYGYPDVRLGEKQ